jgi:uncharacterized protein (DUF4415 family)
MSDDFTKGKRGAVLKPAPGKMRITIRPDADIIEHFKQRVHEAGGGNYQTFINDALREHMRRHHASAKDTPRKVIREELSKAV